jgi:serine/threonine-protein kinase RsbW
MTPAPRSPVARQLELHIPSVLGFEHLAMEFAASVARMMGLPEARVADLMTAVGEACLNAIEHGQHGHTLDAAMKVGITLTVEESSLQVAVRDQGPAIGDVDSPRIEDKIEGRSPPRGWGIFLIKSLMDEVRFESAPEGGNVVKMVIHLKT